MAVEIVIGNQRHKIVGRFLPKGGFTWNPLRGLPRNSPCPCKSGLKFKKCCMNGLPPVVGVEDAKKYREAMERPNLTFVTQHNAERLHQEILDAPCNTTTPRQPQPSSPP